MNITDLAATRFTTKAYDASRSLTDEQITAVISLLQNSPSSLNVQGWHFHIISTQAGREKIAPAIYELNSNKVAEAPLAIVFSSMNRVTDQHLDALVAQENADGRYRDDASRQKNDAGRRGYINNYASSPEFQYSWLERQLYIALGFLLLGAPALGLHATPIEGFDTQKMDRILGLEEQGLHSVVMATVGYNSDSDFNAQLPKSRFPLTKTVTHL
ncbi:oxygen-insensitive NAD(P)H nitroreductase [Rosenbergiella australiborealis]|uniref:Oxygen-insensitive NAD(P)H nitroreductase n=1 Tax=Rosenbergiella australiborealis TaxID=1544696 RepID=A0ABS5T2A3_9GAMM|nr:oxygen-insensitive NAD(P)H nitroreductase [Rosenbergiella australiborealis]MBT0726466.1 oxygen-insensitive NAD(P)H nitroreductase [Rosenbergiella australiborealis]